MLTVFGFCFVGRARKKTCTGTFLRSIGTLRFRSQPSKSALPHYQALMDHRSPHRLTMYRITAIMLHVAHHVPALDQGLIRWSWLSTDWCTDYRAVLPTFSPLVPGSGLGSIDLSGGGDTRLEGCRDATNPLVFNIRQGPASTNHSFPASQPLRL